MKTRWVRGGNALSREKIHQGKQTVSERVYEQLRGLIVMGELAPGEALDQRQLADLLEVSRTPLRQALIRLGQEGLVESRANSSARVALLSRSEAKELYALRAAIEPLVAKNACLALRSKDFLRLRALNKEASIAIKLRRYNDFVVYDREWHRDLYSHSTYSRAKEYVERLRDASDRYVWAYAAHSADSSSSIEEHELILQACERSDIEMVESLVEAHVERGARAMLDLID